MITLGFAGTAKNTGKTTTALHVLGLAQAAGLRCGLTSIGYDGEVKDNITGLPKPRYYLRPGTLLATAETCLNASSAVCRVIERTQVQTVLGPVLVAEVTEPGLVILAGPNRKDDLEETLSVFSRLGADLVLADGALNRIVPLTGADGLVLSTGAAFDIRIPAIAAHARALADLFLPPLWQGRALAGEGILLGRDGVPSIELGSGSLLSEETVTELGEGLKGGANLLVIPGACDPGLLEKVIGEIHPESRPFDLVFGSPLKLVASGDPLAWRRVAGLAAQKGLRTAYLETTALRLITVNPFYPAYSRNRGSYLPAFIEREDLLAAVRSQIPDLPVLDIRQSGMQDILALLGVPVTKG